jgi:hypothetical protein
MENNIENLLSYCSELEFGNVNLTDKQNIFCSELNNEIILLCKSLPQSIQADALIFFMRYSQIPVGKKLNFFRYYYVPTWSILYWLIHSDSDNNGLSREDIKNGKIAHSMAMFLHSLDDRLNDNEIIATHLTLLLRSQSWLIMNNAFSSLADGIDKGEKIVQDFIDDYYSGICSSEDIESLDSYCDLFRKQMATGFIVPTLMTKKLSASEDFTSAIQTAYGSFGIAWRLLDDIKDIQTDMRECIHSSIYICLPEDIKNYWDKNTVEELSKRNLYASIIFEYVLESGLIGRLKKRICNELESAASISECYDMAGLADEFRYLLRPLRNGKNPI